MLLTNNTVSTDANDGSVAVAGVSTETGAALPAALLELIDSQRSAGYDRLLSMSIAYDPKSGHPQALVVMAKTSS